MLRIETAPRQRTELSQDQDLYKVYFTRKTRIGNAHLIVADLKVEVLDFIAMRAAPVTAKECMRPDQVERACHRAAAAILRHH